MTHFANVIKHIINYLIYAMLVVPAIVFSPWQRSSFELPKNYLFLIIGTWLILFFIMYLMEGGIKKISKAQKIFFCILGFIFIFKLISLLLSPHLSYSFWGSYNRQEGTLTHFYLLMWAMILAYFWDNKKQILYSMIPLSLVAGLISLYGDLQKNGWDFSFLVWESGAYNRIASTLGNPLFLSAFLLFTITFSIYGIIQIKNIYWRIGLGVSMLLQLLALYYTYTSSSMLTLAVIIPFGIFIYFWDKKRNISWITATICLLLLIFVTLSSFGYLQNSFSQKVLSDFSVEAKSNLQRIYVWQTGLNAFMEHPWFGWGQELYQNAFYFNRDTHMISPLESRFDRAHNVYLDILVMEGIFVFIGFMTLMGYAMYTSLRKYYRKKELLYLFTTILLVAYMVNYFFSIPTMMSYIFLFMTLGMIFYEPVAPEEKQGRKELYKENNVIIYGVLLVLVCLLTYLYIRPWQADLNYNKTARINNYLQKAEYMQNEVVDVWPYNMEYKIELFKIYSEIVQIAKEKKPDMVEEYLEKAEEMHRHLLKAYPENFMSYISTAMYYRDLGDIEKMNQYYEDAAEMVPQVQEVYWSWADSYVILEDEDKVFEKLEKAINLDPERPYPYQVAADFAGRLGKTEKKVEYLKKFEEKKQVDPIYIKK